MKVPLMDVNIYNIEIKGEIQNAINRVIDSGIFVGPPWIESFEEAFSGYLGASHAIAVDSGTAALHLALLSYDIGKGDEVITTPFTFFATVEAICYTGATPVFVDIDEHNYNIDPNKIEDKITSRTKAIIPVHLYGQPADMTPIINLASKYRLKIIEDACQAHGACYKIAKHGSKKITMKKTGTIGNISCFSFYPTKNLGAYGDGGIVVTNDGELADKIRWLREHGQEKRNVHKLMGYNYRMDAVQAAVLEIKLKYLDKWNKKRRENARLYNELIKNTEIVLPQEMDYAYHVYHLYVIRTKKRDPFCKYLQKYNIGYGIYYPITSHLQPALANLNYKIGNFPIAEVCARETLAIPIFPELTEEQIVYVAEKINNWE